jgi:cytosolic carboxypeptidase protein 2/3
MMRGVIKFITDPYN